MAIKKSSSSGIPFGNDAGRPANPGIGQLYSNGEAQRLELYTSTGWNNIVQAIPGVSSISGNYSEATSSGSITISGTNFTNGAVAYATGQNGLDVVATSTTYNSIVQLTAVFNNLSNAQEPYNIRITNPSGLFGILPNALYVNASPAWQTASGTLGTFVEQVSITLSALSATDSDSQTITYALASGSTLPSGVSLNSSTGVISGTLPNIATDTTYSFTVNATDGLNVIPRTFSITSLALFDVEYLIVGGGGAGSNQIAGGGGAGGMLTGTYSYSKITPISVSVGQGGAAFATTTSGGRGSNGQNSSALGITATGGGSGGHYSASLNGAAGGSGGGGGGDTSGSVSGAASSGAAGINGQGYNGGNGAEYGGGGGGGAGGLGQQGNKGGTRYDSGGNGGPGLASSITGTSTHYAGGGGGGQRDLSTPARSNVWQIRGDGGIGGGGHGSGYTGDNMTGGAYATPGTANTGGGGGGGAHSGTGAGFAGDFRGAAGGSGVVVIAYPNTIPAPTTISGGLTYDQPTRSGYRVYRFTAGSGTVTF